MLMISFTVVLLILLWIIFKSQMMNEFEMSDMGLLHYFLGLDVHQTDDRIFLLQRKYGRDILNKFGMLNCKPAAIRMNIN